MRVGIYNVDVATERRVWYMIDGIIPNWCDKAVCKSLSAKEIENFFPERETGDAKRRANIARSICATCPVSAECLHDALMSNEKFGIWGMTSPKQRIHIKKRYKKKMPSGELIHEWKTIEECQGIIDNMKGK